MIAVGPHPRIRGVSGPETDWRVPGGPRAVFLACEVTTAFHATYSTDAHFVAYVVKRDGEPIGNQPRVNKTGLPFVHACGYVVEVRALVADVDNPAHAEWSPAGLDLELARVRAACPTAGVYATKRGLRLIQPLTRALSPEECELALEAWHVQLAAVGISADPSCKDWTRLFRLPHVMRDGAPYRSPAVLLDGMVPVDPPEPLAREGGARPARRAVSAPRTEREVVRFGSAVESPLARAFARAGWLGRSIDSDRVIARCPWESSHTSGASLDSSTVLFAARAGSSRGRFFCSHAHCQHRSLEDVVEALPVEARAELVGPVGAATEAPSASESAKGLAYAIEFAADGLTVIRAQCGVGKTSAARSVALERARKEEKTAISVPTTALALEVAERLRADGGQVRRLFGVLSVKRENGAPECKLAGVARHLARGGQSIPWELCEGRGERPCWHRSACKAYGGAEGPADAAITVGPHDLLGPLLERAGKRGLVVVDEPPAALETSTIAPSELAAAEAELGRFHVAYAAALAVVLRAVRDWLEVAPVDEPGALSRAWAGGVDEVLLERAWQFTGEIGIEEILGMAFPEEWRGTAPPLKGSTLASVREDEGLAARVGSASRVLRLLYSAATREDVRVRVEVASGERTLFVTEPHDGLALAATRQGPTVIADANADLAVPVLEKIAGYAPHVRAFEAADGAPVDRALIHAGGATRKAWLPHGRLEPSAVVGALRALVDWALEGEAGRLAIVSFLPVELALRAALGEDVHAAWQAAGQSASALEAARKAFAPILERLSAPPSLGHYGALRGLDHWRDHDALATLGDPWPHVGVVRHDAAYLGLEDADERLEGLTRAELEQAHGRLRTIHRTRPARALHVGAVVPGGWRDVEVRTLRGGRPRATSDVEPGEVAELVRVFRGLAKTADIIGVPKPTLARYARGERLPSGEHAWRLRTAIGAMRAVLPRSPYPKPL